MQVLGKRMKSDIVFMLGTNNGMCNETRVYNESDIEVALLKVKVKPAIAVIVAIGI